MMASPNNNLENFMKRLATIIVLLLGVPAVAGATQQDQDAFAARYPKSPLQAASCVICHGPARNSADLNPYALDYKAALADSLGRDAALAKIEPLDSDGDWASNVIEIWAGTRPGDPHSIPSLDVRGSTWSGIKALYR